MNLDIFRIIQRDNEEIRNLHSKIDGLESQTFKHSEEINNVLRERNKVENRAKMSSLKIEKMKITQTDVKFYFI